MDKALEQMLNLLLESERAGVVALEHLAPAVEQEELRKFLLGERDEEQRNVEGLDQLIREQGGRTGARTGRLGGYADRLFASLRGALTGDDRTAALGEVARGES